MVDSPMPTVNTLVEVSVLGGGAYRSRVEDVGDGLVTVAAPLTLLDGDEPGPGTQVTIRWSAGARGRYAASARIVASLRTTVPRWVTQPAGAVAVEQSRQFVRGGGGEAVVLLRHGPEDASPVHGYVVDLSEGGLRARVTDLNCVAGDDLVVTLDLDGETIDVCGQVHRATPEPGDGTVHVVVLLTLPERQAQAVRRYVIRHQLATRNRVRS